MTLLKMYTCGGIRGDSSRIESHRIESNHRGERVNLAKSLFLIRCAIIDERIGISKTCLVITQKQEEEEEKGMLELKTEQVRMSAEDKDTTTVSEEAGSGPTSGLK